MHAMATATHAISYLNGLIELKLGSQPVDRARRLLADTQENFKEVGLPKFAKQLGEQALPILDLAEEHRAPNYRRGAESSPGVIKFDVVPNWELPTTRPYYRPRTLDMARDSVEEESLGSGEEGSALTREPSLDLPEVF